MKFTVNTRILPDQEILQDVEFEHDDGRTELFMRQIMDIKEEHIRKALITLGWTPPKEQS